MKHKCNSTNASARTIWYAIRLMALGFLSFSFFPGIRATAQIVITQSDMRPSWTAGAQMEIHLGSGIVNVGLSGGPNIYDFTGLTIPIQATNTIWRISDIPLLVGHYPDSAVVPSLSSQTVTNTAVFLFTQAALLDLGSVSVSASSDTQRYDHNVPPGVGFDLPLSFGKSWSGTNTNYDTTYVSGIPMKTEVSSRSGSLLVDGFGTLRIPGRELQCLRLKGLNIIGQTKRFWFLTREGIGVYVQTNTGQPDTGNIIANQYLYSVSGSSSAVPDVPQLPVHFKIYHNYPNPFNPSTTIRYEVPCLSMVRLSVYDILGREVSILVNERKNAGRYDVKWDGGNLASGVYFYRLQAGSFVETKKLLLLR